MGVLEGDLKIGGVDFPVALSAVVSGEEVAGSVQTHFDAFKIAPPTVAGGAVAKVAKELELLYRIPLAAVPR